MTDDTSVTLSQVLACFQNLETLCLTRSRGSCICGILSAAIRQYCPNLTGLVLVRWSLNSDEDLADLIGASTLGWKTLGIPIGHHFKSQFGPLSTAALLKHAPTLENLRLEGNDSLSSAAVQKLLSSAPNLRRFAGVCRDRFYERNIKLDARDIATSPWVCLSLESLKVQITNVPRPDIANRTNGRPLQKPRHEQQDPEATKRHSQQIQEQVYDQLGRLTLLKELVLGIHDVNLLEEVVMGEQENEGECYDSGGEEDDGIQTGYQYDCLDMSLQSGLDQMRGVKEIKKVKVEGMATLFRRTEQQEWAKVHWPKLGQRYEDRFWDEFGLAQYF
ncbi:hypothetical protein BGX33_009514 [Mortierella sp. NVP41]|nr:hypothetical protein BGX33_009514 [Mortierella sp. NVP41]